MKKNICLILHCLKKSNNDKVKVNPELFISIDDVEDLINSLSRMGYRFEMPWEERGTGNGNDPVCVFTLDDGYYNNYLFYNLAEKYKIPYICFINSYNVLNGIPFIWDIWNATRSDKWKISKWNYLNLYENLSKSEIDLLSDENYRPLTVDELKQYNEKHRGMYLGLHTHTHQPLVGNFHRNYYNEINKNLHFLKNFRRVKTGDLSLPCGLYTLKTLRTLKHDFERIYTSDGGPFKSNSTIIHRISLINPEIGGDLLSQIFTSFTISKKIRRKISIIKHSNNFLSDI